LKPTSKCGAYRFGYRIPGGRTVIVAGSYLSIRVALRIVFSWIIEPPESIPASSPSDGHHRFGTGAGAELVIRHEKLARIDALMRHDGGWGAGASSNWRDAGTKRDGAAGIEAEHAFWSVRVE